MTTPLQAPDFFITGAHRSGSSWIGQMLAAAGDFLVRDEEIFNCVSQLGAHPFSEMYVHICSDNEGRYGPFVDRMVAHRYPLRGVYPKIHSVRDVARVVKRAGRAYWRRCYRPERTIFVEPIGLCSAEWFAQRFRTQVIVVIRHPAAIISSMKRLNWGFDFAHLSRQPQLMEHYLSPLADELANPPTKPDVIGIGILVWKALYSIVAAYRREHPEWVFVHHETLAANPEAEFAQLYQRVGLPMTEQVQAIIHQHSSAENPAEFVGSRDASRRDSRATIQLWKQRLTEAEIDRIRRGVEPVACQFYDDRSWA